MILSRSTILSKIAYEDMIEEGKHSWGSLQPASYDIHVGPSFLTYNKEYVDFQRIIRLNAPPPDLWKPWPYNCIVLKPGEMVLGHTVECFHLPSDILMMVEGCSTEGRIGVEPVTAGVVDPGWGMPIIRNTRQGQITLEIKNNAPLPIEVYAGDRVGQVIFFQLDNPTTPYGSQVLGSRYTGDFSSGVQGPIAR